MPRSLFDLVVSAERLDPLFREVRERPHFTAARRLMDEVFADFQDVDRSFVREFQTAGFSARIFELALFAYLSEQGYELDRSRAAPDFLIRGNTPIAIEATTTAPAQGTEVEVAGWTSLPGDLPEEEREFVFQVGKALRRKLLKRDVAGLAYWEQPHILGAPFVIALEAFHSPAALFYAIGPLGQYLYGRSDIPTFDSEGRLSLAARHIAEHRRGEKSIPSGLFSQPDAAHLAGVLFTNSGTVAKFNRIGTERGYGPPDVAMVRLGTLPDSNPNAVTPRLFGYVVEPNPADPETFAEGLHFLHNPWASTPLPRGALRIVSEHELLDDGRVLTTSSRLDPFISQTLNFRGPNAAAYARSVLARFLRR